MSKRVHAATHPLYYRGFAIVYEGGRTPWAVYPASADHLDPRNVIHVYHELTDATEHIDEMAMQLPECAVCDAAIPNERVELARARGAAPTYCSDRCRATAAKRRQRAG
jgi:hypothetical protein